MHYFKRNIGDYHKKAGRLTMLQHGAYTLLIDACYDRELFPTEEQAIDWCWACSDAEIEAVRFVLRKFFTQEGEIYTQKRIKEEIEIFRKNAKTNKRIAVERERKRREESTNRVRNVNEPPPNHKPLTTNQEPKEKRGRFTPPSVEEVREYCLSRGNSVNPETFVDFYSSKHWMIGKNKMKDWQASVRTWEKRGNGNAKNWQSNSRAKRVSDKLDQLAREAHEREIAGQVDTSDIQEIPGDLPATVGRGN